MSYAFHDTSHVAKRGRERGFTIDQAILTVEQPEKILKTPPRRGNHGGMIWIFSRPFNRGMLTIVAEVKGNECWIITGYWE